jgi:predicted  nucleic acid-binding Zn-ribbon protein
MKKFFTLVALLIGLLCSTSNAASAQATTAGSRSGPTQEQSLQDLVNEVRQLRAMLQRVTITNYKANIVVERLKFQQEMVTRLSRELNDVRENLADTRTTVARMREQVSRFQAGVDSGVRNADELAAIKLEVDAANQREARLAMRETQVMTDLSTERMRLAELNEQLTKLELEFR